jgi:hypothetical protein
MQAVVQSCLRTLLQLVPRMKEVPVVPRMMVPLVLAQAS